VSAFLETVVKAIVSGRGALTMASKMPL